MICSRRVGTPLGPIELRSDGTRLIAASFIAPATPESHGGEATHDGVLHAAAAQICEYFTGAQIEFDVPLSPSGTEFQLRVWEELRRIRWGEHISYAELATRLGSPEAARAVGAANGRNPIAIFIPCHRVVGSDGSLTGYAGGLERKRRLLDLESGTQSLFSWPATEAALR